MPSAASTTVTMHNESPASTATRAASSTRKQTTTSPQTAKACRTCRRNRASPATSSSNLSPPRIREAAPAAGKRILRGGIAASQYGSEELT